MYADTILAQVLAPCLESLHYYIKINACFQERQLSLPKEPDHPSCLCATSNASGTKR